MDLKPNDKCYLSEIYSAIQGEGPLVGVRQIFLRFSVCDLRCVWCDTPGSLVKASICEIEESVGSRSFIKKKNPITSSELISFIRNLNPSLHHSLSLTGGEPLLHHNFLQDFLPHLIGKFSLPIYLESGGHRVDELKNIIKYLDYISMDFKLPSSAKTNELWDKHKKFLAVSVDAMRKKNTKSAKILKGIWVKLVITADTLFEELEYSINLIKSLCKNKDKNYVEVILQPVSQFNGSKPPAELRLLRIHAKLLTIYPYIRVLPQVHRLIGQK